MESVRTGQSVGDYRIDSVVAEDASSTLYRATHTGSQRTHTVEVPRHPVSSERIRQLTVLAGLDHPNLVSTVEVLDLDGTPALVTRQVEGPSLSRLLAGARLPLLVADRLGCGITAGVAAAHRFGAVHIQPSPQRIIVTLEGGTYAPMIRPRLGLPVLESLDGAVARYIAPEVIEQDADVDARADVFSLGVVLYELMTGAKAFDGAHLEEVLRAVRTGTFVPPDRVAEGLPRHFATAISGSLVPDREFRIQSVQSLVAVWEGKSPTAAPAAPTPAAPQAQHPAEPPSDQFQLPPARTVAPSTPIPPVYDDDDELLPTATPSSAIERIVAMTDPGAPEREREEDRRVTLDDLLGSGALALDDVKRVFRSLVEEVAKLHRRRKKNLWLCPKLVELSFDGDVIQVVLVEHEGGERVGHAAYAAPESLAKNPTADTRSDVFSLGCLLYHMVHGQSLFRARDTPEERSRRYARMSALPPEMPPGWVDVMTRAIALEPEVRYADALAFGHALFGDGFQVGKTLVVDVLARRRVVRRKRTTSRKRGAAPPLFGVLPARVAVFAVAALPLLFALPVVLLASVVLLFSESGAAQTQPAALQQAEAFTAVTDQEIDGVITDLVAAGADEERLLQVQQQYLRAGDDHTTLRAAVALYERTFYEYVAVEHMSRGQRRDIERRLARVRQAKDDWQAANEVWYASIDWRAAPAMSMGFAPRPLAPDQMVVRTAKK